MLLKLRNNLIHNLHTSMPLALRLPNLLRVAAARLDEVVAIIQPHISTSLQIPSQLPLLPFCWLVEWGEERGNLHVKHLANLGSERGYMLVYVEFGALQHPSGSQKGVA